MDKINSIEQGNENLEKMVVLGSFVGDFTSKMDGILTIKPNDVIVIKIPMEYCDEETTKYLKSMFKSAGFKNTIMVFQDIIQIGVLRKEEDNGSK